MPFVTAPMICAVAQRHLRGGHSHRALRLRGRPGAADALRALALPGAPRGRFRVRKEDRGRGTRRKPRASSGRPKCSRTSTAPRTTSASGRSSRRRRRNARRPPDPRRDLIRREEPFALATVVRRQPASSSQSGDMALVSGTGQFHGWLGGSCTQPTVVREALRALADGKPRLISLSSRARGGTPSGSPRLPMTCHSGGSVDIYIEPISPPARFLVFGLSPVSRSLARLAKANGIRRGRSGSGGRPGPVPRGGPVLDGPAVSRAAARLAALRRRRHDGRARRGGRRSSALDRPRVPGRRRELQEVRADPRQPRGAGNPGPLRSRGSRTRPGSTSARRPRRRSPSRSSRRSSRRAGARRASRSPRRRRPPSRPPCGRKRSTRSAACRSKSPPRSTARNSGGRTWYFCCAGCRERFLAAPQKFGAAAERERADERGDPRAPGVDGARGVHRRARDRDPRSSSRSRCASRFSSRGTRGSARPRSRKCSRGCSRPSSSGCSATKVSTSRPPSTSGTTRSRCSACGWRSRREARRRRSKRSSTPAVTCSSGRSCGRSPGGRGRRSFSWTRSTGQTTDSKRSYSRCCPISR
jgi:xanthine dehydrogenase accessory factor